MALIWDEDPGFEDELTVPKSSVPDPFYNPC